MEVKSSAMVDEAVLGAGPLTRFQFERIGYFCVDFDSTPQQVIHTNKITQTSWHACAACIYLIYE